MMTWPQVIANMRQQDWNVAVTPLQVDVVTTHHQQGRFERSEKGLQKACFFYQEHQEPGRFTYLNRRHATSFVRRRAYRVVRTSRSRVLASLLIGVCSVV